MRRFLLTAATAATALVGTACGDVTGINGDVVGSYELVRVNGQSLPASDNSGTVTFHDGVLELRSNRTFVDFLRYSSFADPRILDFEESGNWERSGNDEILLDYDDGSTLRAERLSSSRLMLRDDDGNRFEYRRF
jgi:hypothetical protein